MVYKAIRFRVDVYQYHVSSHGKLEQIGKVIHRFIDVIYWLYLFISFIYSIWWLYFIFLTRVLMVKTARLSLRHTRA